MMNSLGINKLKKDTKVVVAMSGGVDSSVVADTYEARRVRCHRDNIKII